MIEKRRTCGSDAIGGAGAGVGGSAGGEKRPSMSSHVSSAILL